MITPTRLSEIEAHADEGGTFQAGIVQELIGHIRALSVKPEDAYPTSFCPGDPNENGTGFIGIAMTTAQEHTADEKTLDAACWAICPYLQHMQNVDTKGLSDCKCHHCPSIETSYGESGTRACRAIAEEAVEPVLDALYPARAETVQAKPVVDEEALGRIAVDLIDAVAKHLSDGRTPLRTAFCQAIRPYIRTTEPVSVALEKCVNEVRIYRGNTAFTDSDLAKAVLKAVGVKFNED